MENCKLDFLYMLNNNNNIYDTWGSSRMRRRAVLYLSANVQGVTSQNTIILILHSFI